MSSIIDIEEGCPARDGPLFVRILLQTLSDFGILVREGVTQIMIAVVCIDDKNGMLFNRRRQSQDRILREDLLREVNGAPLWMNAYSAKQFGPLPENIRVAEDFPEQAASGEYGFVETQDPASWSAAPESLIVYRWNRNYPADLFFTLPLEGWTLARREEFAGSSHENITKEVYIR